MMDLERIILLFYLLKMNLDLEKYQLGQSSPSFIFATVNFTELFWKRGELMVNSDSTSLMKR